MLLQCSHFLQTVAAGTEFHSVIDTAIIDETKSVPPANVCPEHQFAILDRLMSEKPKLILTRFLNGFSQSPLLKEKSRLKLLELYLLSTCKSKISIPKGRN